MEPIIKTIPDTILSKLYLKIEGRTLEGNRIHNHWDWTLVDTIHTNKIGNGWAEKCLKAQSIAIKYGAMHAVKITCTLWNLKNKDAKGEATVLFTIDSTNPKVKDALVAKAKSENIILDEATMVMDKKKERTPAPASNIKKENKNAPKAPKTDDTAKLLKELISMHKASDKKIDGIVAEMTALTERVTALEAKKNKKATK